MPRSQILSPRSIRVQKAKHSGHWLVFDSRPPKVFIRMFVFSYFEAAVKEAHRLAATGLINPRACFGCQRLTDADAWLWEEQAHA